MGGSTGRFVRARLVALAATVATSGVMVVPLVATSAAADVAPAAGTPATVSADPLPTWQVNGVVWNQVVVGNTVYATGDFTTARPPGVAVGGAGEIQVGHLIAYDIRTGERIAGFDHVLNGQGIAITASPDGSTLFVGGDFTTVDGVARSHLASFDISSGALTNVAFGVDGSVKALAATNSTLYVGGSFLTVRGQTRTRLAAYTYAQGTLTGWAPTASGGNVTTMVMAPDHSKVVVGGAFPTLNGETVNGWGALDAGSGAVLPWAANQTIKDYTNGAIDTLSTDGVSIFGGGYAFGAGATFEGVFSVNPADGAINWVADCQGDTYGVYPVQDAVYVASHEHNCTMVGGFPDTNPRVRWQRASAFSKVATQVNAGPDMYGWNYKGIPAPSLLHWYPELAMGSASGAGQAAWSVAGSGDYVVYAGEFPKVNGIAQQGLVRFAKRPVSPGAVGPQWGTTPARPAPTVSATAIGGGAVRVSFGSAWDKDNQALTYTVIRDRWTTNEVVVGSIQSASNFWTLPTLSITDQNVPAGPHKYFLRVTDSDGNKLSPELSNVVDPAQPVSPFAQQVIADGANHYWRLGDAAGATTATDMLGGANGAVQSGVAMAQTGAISADVDTAAGFSGTTSGYVAGGGTASAAPQVFTVSAWFNTTTTSGGKIIGWGTSATGNSSSYDRHIYMDNSGKLLFGVSSGGRKTIATQGTYNDGQWHQVVGTLSPAGLFFYVDGRLVASNVSITFAENTNGFWRIGGDNLGSWANVPSSYYFKGNIDEVATYPVALTGAQVAEQFVRSGRTVAGATRPADAYGASVFDSTPQLYWRMAETGGIRVVDSSTGNNEGLFTGTPGFGVAGVVGANSAVNLGSSSASAASLSNFSAMNVYSTELWIKTTTTRGGKLIGWGDKQTGLSTNIDRNLTMLNSGQIRFSALNGGIQYALDSTAKFNDGKWHHVVAAQGPSGMTLYVDGLSVASNEIASDSSFAGYWRVGYDKIWSGSSNTYLAGTFDEVAVYPRVLSLAEVKAHHRASGRTVSNSAPVASPDAVINGLSVAVSGSGSFDPDGTISAYAWDFGDGTSATGATAHHTYPASGTYTVTLTVTDNEGATSTTSKAVATANLAPTAAFTSTKAQLVAGFDASASVDSDGSIASYAWNFGDGTTGSGANTSHTYDTAGTYQVTLTVTDNAGGIGTVTHDVVVAPTQAPVATFTSTDSGLDVSVDASGSSDPDGSIVGYSWDFGDGAAGTGVTATHSYAQAGTYSITLKVTDNEGAVSSKTADVTLTVNTPPSAVFTAASSDLAASFDGTASTDPDGSVASYAWSFGDGTQGTGGTVQHTFDGPGTYQVRLTVTDNRGATGSLTQSVTVTAPIGKDVFDRTVSGGWGTAATGGSWTVGGGAANFAVAGGWGKMVSNAAGGTLTAYLKSLSSAGTDLQVQFSLDKMPTGGGHQVIVTPRGSATDGYRAKVVVSSTGVATVYLIKTVAGVDSTLASKTMSGTFVPGDVYQVRAQVFGQSPTTIRASLYKAGTPEPSSWLVSASDATAALQGPGAVGIGTYMSGSASNMPLTAYIGQLFARAM